jgi:hypothetical protein
MRYCAPKGEASGPAVKPNLLLAPVAGLGVTRPPILADSGRNAAPIPARVRERFDLGAAAI